MKKLSLVLVGVVILSACIVGETEHRIYIHPDGSAVWVVLERDLHSTEKRVREEREFLDDVRRGAHPVEQAFWSLGADWVELRLLRDRRPFSIWTEARFDSLEELSREMLFQLGLRGEVMMSTAGGVTRLDVLVEAQDFEGELQDEAVLALLDELSSYRVVLSEGRFVEAVGFELTADGTAALPVEVQEGGDSLDGAPLSISLAWSS